MSWRCVLSSLDQCSQSLLSLMLYCSIRTRSLRSTLVLET